MSRRGNQRHMSVVCFSKDPRRIHMLPHGSYRMFNAAVKEHSRPRLPPSLDSCAVFLQLQLRVEPPCLHVCREGCPSAAPVQPRVEPATPLPPTGPVGVCVCPLYLTSQVSVCHVLTHICDSDTQSLPLRLLHILVMTNTPVLQNALAGPHTSGEQRESSIKCESAALCPGSNLRDQSCFFSFSPPSSYFYILLFLINPVLRLFLKFPEKMSLTFWNSVSGLWAMW